MNADARPVSAPAQGRNYPLNCWWVAATIEEITRQPLERWLLDHPLVFYRTEAGAPVALDNRCIHRWAPLSLGYMEGDQLVCGYHGARFGPDGRCTRFPTQESAPQNARVRSYTLVERGPFVWIWMGDDARRADADLPPDFAWTKDPAWTVTQGSFLLEANYMLLHENVLDLTHFNYLHRDSFKITNRRPPEYKAEGNQVWSDDVYDAAAMSSAEREAMRFTPYDLRHETKAAFLTPAWHHATGRTRRAPNPELPEETITYVNHLLTPESPSRSHYWWLLGNNTPMTPDIAAGLKARVEVGYHEDKVMLAAIQAMIDRDPRGRDYPELSFRGDAGGIQARRALDRIMAAD